MRQVAMAHGAVDDVRVNILLDTGASVSMISLDLARRLKVNFNRHKQIKVSRLGGIPTCITASTQVKVTLRFRVVYVVDVWVPNIGEGVDVLLSMNFMYSRCATLRS
jgi:predicted aspartyl protease